MPAKRTIVRDGVYRDQRGKFWIRVWVRGKRKWHRLEALNLKYAEMEARALKTDQARAKVGQAKDPFGAAGSFQRLADLYLAARCPNQKMEPRGEEFCATEKYRLKTILEFWGRMDPEEIGKPQAFEYSVWRKDRCRRGSGGDRTVDLDLVTASNVLNYAVGIGLLKNNGIASKRPRFRVSRDVVHSRERAPANGDQIHQIAEYMFSELDREVLGWLVLFSAMTGCRNVELRMLRSDARTPDEPGFISGGFLFLRRAKGGKFPYRPITDDFAEMLHCYLYWKQCRYPDSRWYFPTFDGREALHKDTLRNSMYRANEEKGFPNITPHGLRSFYVTKRRSDGIPDLQIAAEIGDSTVALISTTYGDLPPNWTPGAGEKLSFRPTEGLPSWERWRPIEEKIVSI